VQLELIEPNEAHSVWRDEMERLEEGLHHIAFTVDNIDEVERNHLKTLHLHFRSTAQMYKKDNHQLCAQPRVHIPAGVKPACEGLTSQQ
jgi:hypothetical protein